MQLSMLDSSRHIAMERTNNAILQSCIWMAMKQSSRCQRLYENFNMKWSSWQVCLEFLKQVLNGIVVIILETPPQTSNRDLHHQPPYLRNTIMMQKRDENSWRYATLPMHDWKPSWTLTSHYSMQRESGTWETSYNIQLPPLHIFVFLSLHLTWRLISQLIFTFLSFPTGLAASHSLL